MEFYLSLSIIPESKKKPYNVLKFSQSLINFEVLGSLVYPLMSSPTIWKVILYLLSLVYLFESHDFIILPFKNYPLKAFNNNTVKKFSDAKDISNIISFKNGLQIVFILGCHF